MCYVLNLCRLHSGHTVALQYVLNLYRLSSGFCVSRHYSSPYKEVSFLTFTHYCMNACNVCIVAEMKLSFEERSKENCSSHQNCMWHTCSLFPRPTRNYAKVITRAGI